VTPVSASGDIVGPIELQTASDVLADRLRAQILSGELPAGTQLPVERELVERTGLSRTVVREALKALAREGLVRTRAGRNGGTVVIRPGTGSIVRSLDQFAQAGDVPLDALLEARELIEPICAGLAATRRTEEQLAELETIHDRLAAARGQAAAEPENIRWHVAVARASGNDLLASFVEGLASVRKAGTENRHLSARMRRGVVEAHAAIMVAIRAGDGEAAARRMRRHIAAYRETTGKG
jgi:DNA-binding FadR family transcriptional regulator